MKDMVKSEEGMHEKLPYNIKEKISKNLPYHAMIRRGLADKLYQDIVQKVIVEKGYRDPHLSAKKMAVILDTNTRYLSAVINSRFGENFPRLINEYRVRDALILLKNKKKTKITIDEVSKQVGFNNRQSFYATFYRIMGMTPLEYCRKEWKV